MKARPTIIVGGVLAGEFRRPGPLHTAHVRVRDHGPLAWDVPTVGQLGDVVQHGLGVLACAAVDEEDVVDTQVRDEVPG